MKVIKIWKVILLTALFTAVWTVNLVAEEYATEAFEIKEEWIQMNDGLTYKIITEGYGEVAETGMRVVVHYTGTFKNGEKFDSSVDRGEPFEFPLGAGMVIKGWDLGVLGMKVGEKRILNIPSDLAYGKRGAGNVIPPNTDLLFEVELLALKK